MSESEKPTLVSAADKEKYQEFCTFHLPHFSRGLPETIWHYTNASGLIGILTSGEIYTTQVACLNDSLEQRYFGDLVLEHVREKLAGNNDSDLSVLLAAAEEGLRNRDFSATGHFVACFSEIEDDLGQWRGYGGGECGYAIGFQAQSLYEALRDRSSGFMLPMNYDAQRHQQFVQDVVTWAETFFRQGISEGKFPVDTWAEQFLAEFARKLDVFASIIKHPKFVEEQERRILTLLKEDEHLKLKFTQKRTLLARHLPLDLTIESEQKKRALPLSSVYVGPGPAQKTSKISVGDLLLQRGYKDVPVKLSQVPYRVP